MSTQSGSLVGLVLPVARVEAEINRIQLWCTHIEEFRSQPRVRV